MTDQPHILIIDDDPFVRRLLAKALQNEGMKTSEASSGQIGVEIFKEQGADAVLIDVIMPNGLDGYAACEQIRVLPNGQFTPLLMMTGLEDIDSINQAYEAGATDFVTKPVNAPLLGHRIRYMLKSAITTERLVVSEKRLHNLAYYDSLTELPNRTFFQEHLQIIIALARRLQHKFAILYLDIDGFKRINDSLGHHFGDAILQETGIRLRNTLRASDAVIRVESKITNETTLARLGGDEFTILLSQIERNEDAAIVAERIRIDLSKPFKINDHEFYATTSIGISVFPTDGKTEADLIKNADLAMYHAKRAGGNAYRYFSTEMTDIAKNRLILENHLHKAIERNELELHYQPQFDLITQKYCGVEALLRWHCQALGNISPVDFIPLAEENGLIIKLGEWVLRTACTQAKYWQDSGLQLNRIAVNVSPKQLLRVDFPELVAKILVETNLAPSALELEVTESALISEEHHIQKILQPLKAIGIQLSIDDFGTGYSSLSRLMNFPIDRLKIDQSFIRDLEQNPSKVAVVSAIIHMAEGMGMNAIAEGIETQAQLDFVKNNQCKEAQGYWLCKPLPAKQVEAFLRAHIKN